MSLSGSFEETPFSDLVQFYDVSKQTAIVRVRIRAGADPDGVFLFAGGDLVGASLGGVEGREAVRRALRLRSGTFTSETGSWPVEGVRREPLRNVLMEEVLRLDEENRALGGPSPRGRYTGAYATSGSNWFVLPVPAQPGGNGASAVAPAVGPELAGEPAVARPPPLASAAPAAIPPRRDDAAATAAAPQPRPPAALGPPAPPLRASRGIGGTFAGVALAAVVTLALGTISLWAASRRGDAGAARTRAAVTAPVRGVLDDAVVLGMVSSFTGSNKERGRAMRIGWDMAVAEVNEAGGVHGRKLRLVTEDDGYDPSRTLAGMKQVIDEQGAFAIVGNVGTSTAAVAVPYATEKDAIFFGALSGGDLLRKTPPDRHVFNFRASLAREGQAAVRYLVEVRRLDPKRIAVLAQDDEFGASGRRGAVQQLTTYGITAGDVLQLAYPRNTADVRDAVTRLQARAREFDAVVMVATYKPAATFVRKSRDAGLNLFYTTVSADSNGLAEELVESGAQYTQNVLLTQVVPVPTSHASTLIRYREALARYAPGEKPGSTSLEAWIGAQIFVEGLRRAGRDLDTAALIAALETISDWDIGIGGRIGFGPGNHQGCEAVWGWLLQPDGTYRQIDLE